MSEKQPSSVQLGRHSLQAQLQTPQNNTRSTLLTTLTLV